MAVAVLNADLRSLCEEGLPDWLEARWFSSSAQLLELAPSAEIGWFDGPDITATYDAVRRASGLVWLNTIAAGIDPFPLALLRERQIVLTNGAGLNAPTIAEYAVMAMLTLAKGYREVVRAQDRHQWLGDSPGKAELCGAKALIIGSGGIGVRLGDLLRAFGVTVTDVRRRGSAEALGPEEWRERLGEFDWVIVNVPATAQTRGMISRSELAAMKSTAFILNFARGTVLDQSALIQALRERHIAGAFLDVTDPEPLPPDNPLWSLANCHISMHLSGRSQTTLYRRGIDRFLRNLERYERGEPLEAAVNLDLGY